MKTETKRLDDPETAPRLRFGALDFLRGSIMRVREQDIDSLSDTMIGVLVENDQDQLGFLRVPDDGNLTLRSVADNALVSKMKGNSILPEDARISSLTAAALVIQAKSMGVGYTTNNPDHDHERGHWLGMVMFSDYSSATMFVSADGVVRRVVASHDIAVKFIPGGHVTPDSLAKIVGLSGRPKIDVNKYEPNSIHQMSRLMGILTAEEQDLTLF